MKIKKELAKRKSDLPMSELVLTNLFSEDEKVSIQLANAQIANAIFEKPSFLEYAAYVCFFPTLQSGPVFEIRPFLEYVKLDNWEKSLSLDEKQRAMFELSEKFPTKAVITRIITLALSMFIHVTCSSIFDRNGLLKDRGSFFFNFLFMLMCFWPSMFVFLSKN